MKATIQSIILAVLMFATGIANSDNAFVDEYGNQLIGIVYATCTVGFRDGRQFSKVITVDRSDEQIPAPRKGSTCAKYTAELMKSGARVEMSDMACDPMNDPYPVPLDGGYANFQICMAVIAAMYGPGLW
jgi:hypothetical protein